MADVTLSSVRGQSRRRIITLTASDSAVPIPSWAQGGKGLVYVTGVGGGGSGGVSTTSGKRGGGGGAGGLVRSAIVQIPPGVTTVAVVIGSGGDAVSASGIAQGIAGGSTSLDVGGKVLTLVGGNGGSDSSGGNGGDAFLGASRPGNSMIGSESGSGLYRAGGTFGKGTNGLGGANTDGGGETGYGAGAYSFFGTGGAGLSSGPSVNTNGASAAGFGAGGAGALWLSGSAVTSGAGAPGILILEFMEGV